MKRKRLIWMIAAALLSGGSAIAQAQAPGDVRIEFRPETTKIEFTLEDVLHTVHGTFRLKSGMMHFNQATHIADGALVVDTSSGASGNDTRDRKMKNEILETGKYPEATFVPKKITGALAESGASQIEVEGTFRIHGAEHEITLVVPAEAKGNEVQFHTEFKIPFVQWGMKDPSTFVLRVKKEVTMTISGTETLRR